MCSGCCNDPVEIFTDKEKGLVLRIFQDNDPESPRAEDYNLGKMLLWHDKYDLGDKHEFRDNREFMNYVEMEKVVWLPVYVYEHTGMVLSTKNTEYPFSDMFDAGQLGFIYMKNEILEKEFKGDKEAALQALRDEVETYSAYCNSEVFGFEVSKAVYDENGEIDLDEEGEYVESCFGFYGEDHKKSGLFESANWTAEEGKVEQGKVEDYGC